MGTNETVMNIRKMMQNMDEQSRAMLIRHNQLADALAEACNIIEGLAESHESASMRRQLSVKLRKLRKKMLK